MPDEAETEIEEGPVAGPSAILGGKVFISYASQDTNIAVALCNALEHAGVPCWMAPRDVRPGDFYADSIVHAITAAPAFVLILSRGAIDSPHVLREIERASSKKRRIVAFRIDTTPLQPHSHIPERGSHWLDREQWRSHATDSKAHQCIARRAESFRAVRVHILR